MALFDGLSGKKKKDEYTEIYDNGDDSGIDYSDLDEDEDVDAAVDRLRGTIESSDCLYCGGKLSMKHEDNCFICSKCGRSVHEDLMYRDIAGYPVEIDEDDDYDEFYEDDE